MREALRSELAFEIATIALGAEIAYVSWGYGFGSLEQPGPGLYPFFVGLAITLFALTLVVRQRSTHRAEPVFKNASARTFVLMGLTFCFWIAAMPLLGYVVVTLLATFAFCKAMKLEGWRKPLAVSAGTALFIFLLFDYWLYIDLPRGIFAG